MDIFPREILVPALDWFGCICGVAGAYLIAAKVRFSRYGFLIYLLANLSYIAMAIAVGLEGLMTQHIAFMGSSLLGVYRHFHCASQRVEEVR